MQKVLLFISIAAAGICNAGEVTPFASVTKPIASADGHSHVMGFYSHGCIRGAKDIPVSSPCWEFVNVSRNRHYGHPDAETFLKELCSWSISNPKAGKLIVGDVAQPAGGPLPFGHKSHQMGLDLDIRFGFAPARKEMPTSVREGYPEVDVAEYEVVKKKKDGKEIDGFELNSKIVEKEWKPQYGEMLAKAAESSKVERIFVSAPIKEKLCQTFAKTDNKGAKTYPAWLSKITPEEGHTSHFHVRLACPAGDAQCEKQKPVNSEAASCDGGAMKWWLDKNENGEDSYLKDEIKKQTAKADPNASPAPPEKPKPSQYSQLPQACRDMIAPPATPASVPAAGVAPAAK